MRERLGARRRAAGALAGVPELFGRQSTDCVSGESFYRCSINNFAGCCQVDPCALKDGCPIVGGPSVKSTTEQLITITATVNPPAVRGTSTTTTPPTITLARPTGDGESRSEAATTTATEDSAVVPTDAGGPSKDQDGGGGGGGGRGLPGGAIAGIVIGMLALILFLLAAWFFLRRRKRQTLAAADGEVPPPSDENDDKFLGAAAASATSPVFSHLGGGKSPSPASTPGLGKYPSPASTPGLGNAGRYSSPASTPGLGGDPRSSKISYVSALTVSDTPPAGMAPFPAVAQLDGTPVVLAEMDGTTAAALGRLSELSAVSDAAPPAQGMGVQSSEGRQQGANLPTVAEDGPSSGPGVLRGTLNPTEAERSGRTYVTSWSQYEGGPKK